LANGISRQGIEKLANPVMLFVRFSSRYFPKLTQCAAARYSATLNEQYEDVRSARGIDACWFMPIAEDADVALVLFVD
jgi:hypothetical protein